MRAGGAAAPEHDGEDARDLEQQARERLVRVLRKRLEQPTAAEVQEHEISGHEPYRSWCRACVAGRGRADAHVGRPGVDKGVPIIGVDHGYLWSRAPEASDAPHDEVAGEDPPDGVRTSSPVLCGNLSPQKEESGKVDLSQSEIGSAEDVTGRQVANKPATGEPYASSKSDCQGCPKAERTAWSYNLHVSPATIHQTEAAFSIVRGFYGREHDDFMDDLGVNMIIWGIFLNTTLRAAVHLGQGYDANLRYVKSSLWNSVGRLLHETGKLISEQKEITGVSTKRFQRCYVDVDNLIM